MNITVNYVLIALIIVAAVAIGLTLRFFLVRRLKKTILDNWIVQLLGAVVFVLPIVGAILTLPFLLQIGQLSDFISNFLLKNLPEIT
ncbi:MAG TPA: hypothetical protein VIY29_24700, partial [Ktedonobacteraceae bacterium]